MSNFEYTDPEFFAKYLEGLAFQMQMPDKQWEFDTTDIKALNTAAELMRELAEKAWMYDDLCK
jgi:hypothetical protein